MQVDLARDEIDREFWKVAAWKTERIMVVQFADTFYGNRLRGVGDGWNCSVTLLKLRFLRVPTCKSTNVKCIFLPVHSRDNYLA
jgi:hypothetical protein